MGTTSDYSVAREDMRWRVDDSLGGDPALIPIMRTDVTLRSKCRTVVMDAKFYADPFPKSRGVPKLRSGHLYQLFAYMKHAGDRAPDLPVGGTLVYASPGSSSRQRYRVDGHEIAIAAIDLTQPWPKIHLELLALLSGFDVDQLATAGPQNRSSALPAGLAGAARTLKTSTWFEALDIATVSHAINVRVLLGIVKITIRLSFWLYWVWGSLQAARSKGSQTAACGARTSRSAPYQILAGAIASPYWEGLALVPEIRIICLKGVWLSLVHASKRKPLHRWYGR